jgi:hypothetical protein
MPRFSRRKSAQLPGVIPLNLGRAKDSGNKPAQKQEKLETWRIAIAVIPGREMLPP